MNVLVAVLVGCGPSAPSIALMCPPTRCNEVTGGVAGESLVLEDSCVLVGALLHSVVMASEPLLDACEPASMSGPALEVRFESVGGLDAEYSSASWRPAGADAADSLPATAGTVELRRFDINDGVRLGFDLEFGGDRICGCVDTSADAAE